MCTFVDGEDHINLVDCNRLFNEYNARFFLTVQAFQKRSQPECGRLNPILTCRPTAEGVWCCPDHSPHSATLSLLPFNVLQFGIRISSFGLLDLTMPSNRSP